MPLLEVTNGPTPPAGLTLTADTRLTIEYHRLYSDNVDTYPQVYRAEYDVTNGTWKPEGSADGTTFQVPGAGPNDPVPPSVRIYEIQRYSSADGVDSIRLLGGIYADSGVSNTWNYAGVDSNYAILTQDGSDDVRIKYMDVSTESGTLYTLALEDTGKLKLFTSASAVTVTVPTNASVGFAVGAQVVIGQYGDGAVSVSPVSGVTMTGLDNFSTLAGKGATAVLVKVGVNEWLLSGGLTYS